MHEWKRRKAIDKYSMECYNGTKLWVLSSLYTISKRNDIMESVCGSIPQEFIVGGNNIVTANEREKELC